MKFLFLMHMDRGLTPGPDIAARYGALGQEMRAAGVLVDNGQLSPGDASKLVRVIDGTTEVSNGGARPDGAPLAYFVVECADVDDAVSWAARIPAAEYGTVEVRPQR
jgi:hypothetical protein